MLGQAIVWLKSLKVRSACRGRVSMPLCSAAAPAALLGRNVALQVLWTVRCCQTCLQELKGGLCQCKDD